MTYAEWIERVTRALASVSDEEWARTRTETKEYFREQARVAIAAMGVERMWEVLQSITREINWSEFPIDSPGSNTAAQIIGEMRQMARAALEAAIPRGEEP